MAAGDPLAQFHPVSLHPPALLHPAASCVTSPVTLNHPRLCRGHPFCTGNAPTLAEALPPPFRGGKEVGGKTAVPCFQTPSIFLGRTFFRASSTSALSDIFIPQNCTRMLKETIPCGSMHSFRTRTSSTSTPLQNCLPPSRLKRNIRLFREITPALYSARKLHFYCCFLLPAHKKDYVVPGAQSAISQYIFWGNFVADVHMSNYFHEYQAKVLHRYNSQYTPRSTLCNEKEFQRAITRMHIHFIVIYDNDLACWPSFGFYSIPNEKLVTHRSLF